MPRSCLRLIPQWRPPTKPRKKAFIFVPSDEQQEQIQKAIDDKKHNDGHDLITKAVDEYLKDKK